MPPLSATDAITPAWQHTRQLLLGPRNVRLLFKLAAVAFFAQMGGCSSFNFNAPASPIHSTPSAIAAGLMAVVVFSILAVVLVIGLVLFYIGSRLQFVLFHFVLRSETHIAPMWRRYGPATWRWIGLKLLLGLCAMACILPIAVPAIFFFVHETQHQTAGGGNTAAFVFTIFIFVLACILIVLALTTVFVLVRDFGLPSMALEATPLRETVRRVFALARAEPGQVALYVLMRFVLSLAGVMASYLVLLVVGLVSAIPLGGVGVALWAALHHSTVGGHVIMGAGFGVLGVILCAALVITGITVFGYLFTFLQAYAIFFLSGRYPLLAQQLTPPAPSLPRSWTFAPWTPGLYTPPPV
jgi:hypothetical protein